MATYAEFIGETLKDKVVQIYFGNNHEETHYDDSSRYVASVMVGRVVSGTGACLIINCDYVEDDTSIRTGNYHYVQASSITTLTELNGKGSFKEAFRSVNSIK